MADNAPAPTAVATPAPTVAPSQGPAAATPPAPAPAQAAEPAASSSPAPAPESVASLPAAADAPAASAAPSDTAAQQEQPKETPKAESSILGDTLKPEEKPEEKPAAEAPKTDAPAAEAVPGYEKYNLPEGVTLDDTKVGQFNKILGEFEGETKTDHTKMQMLGQRMVDLYTGEAKELSERLTKNQVDTWNRTKENWREDFRKDKEIGGNRQETTLRQCRAVLERYKASAGDKRANDLTKAFSTTGAGDNPALIHFINWASQFAVERARPVAAQVPKAPATTSRAQRRYANRGE